MNNTDTIKTALRLHLFETFVGDGDIEELTDTLHLYDSGVLDSIGTLQLADFIESKWSIAIEAHDMTKANFSSISKICDFIEKKLA